MTTEEKIELLAYAYAADLITGHLNSAEGSDYERRFRSAICELVIDRELEYPNNTVKSQLKCLLEIATRMAGVLTDINLLQKDSKVANKINLMLKNKSEEYRYYIFTCLAQVAEDMVIKN
jgi:hypothetical protein